MNPTFPSSLYAAVFAAAVAIAPVAVHAMGDEEFVGPFASWANVKTNYGAVGDGVTDDTAAIQKALNALGPNNPTLYFPAGTYRISQTLTLAGQLYVNMIGQDPANTTILWDGSAGSTMLFINGVAGSRFDRLTFNGQGTAAIAVDLDWQSGYFPTGNEFTDDEFENAGTGLRCGETAGCSETSMLRDQFIKNTVSGISMKNFNALDMWVWYSLFQDNAQGIGNYDSTGNGAGNFDVYNSVFQGSTTADIVYGNTSVFDFRNNYSIGSNGFIWAGGTCGSNNVIVQGNTVLDTTNPLSIRQEDKGPMVLIDNVVRSAATDAAGPVVKVYNCTGDLFSIGNTFTVSSPTYADGHYHSVQDQVVARSTINPTLPTLPGTPPNLGRTIYEIASGSTAAQIQTAINSAAAGCTNNVAHIQPGTYRITSTLTVPAACPVQIIGDGGNSLLTAAGANPVMRLQGPSKAILRDFSVNGNNYSAVGIEVDNADQVGSSIFMEQVLVGQSNNNLFVDALDYAKVELHDFQHDSGDQAQGGVNSSSVMVTGGPLAAAGSWQGGVTNIFMGLAADNYYGYGVSNGAHVAVEAVWNDTGGSGGANAIANVTGTSAFTYAGSELALGSSNPVAVALDNFQGTAALVNLATTANIDISGNGGTAQVLGLGLVGPSTTFFSNTSSPAATIEFLNGLQNPNSSVTAPTELPETGTAVPSFLTAALNQLRTEQPTLLAPLANGVTDARFYRVFVGTARTGIHLQAGSAVSPDGTTISAPTGSLVTSAGTWTFGPAQQAGERGQYQILLNGSTKWPAGQGYAAEMKAANGGRLYTYNSFVKGWWIWTGSVWAKSAAP